MSNSGWRPIVFSLACMLGSVLWYFILIRFVFKHHLQFQPTTFKKIFIGLALMLLGFAIYTLITIFI